LDEREKKKNRYYFAYADEGGEKYKKPKHTKSAARALNTRIRLILRGGEEEGPGGSKKQILAMEGEE